MGGTDFHHYYDVWAISAVGSAAGNVYISGYNHITTGGSQEILLKGKDFTFVTPVSITGVDRTNNVVWGVDSDLVFLGTDTPDMRGTTDGFATEALIYTPGYPVISFADALNLTTGFTHCMP